VVRRLREGARGGGGRRQEEVLICFIDKIKPEFPHTRPSYLAGQLQLHLVIRESTNYIPYIGLLFYIFLICCLLLLFGITMLWRTESYHARGARARTALAHMFVTSQVPFRPT
jgi:hypothetical protein